MNRITILRLVSGEEILTEVVGEVSTPLGATHLKIKNPVRIIVMPSKLDKEAPQVALAPWLHFAANKEQNIPMASIILDYEPVPEFVNQHKSLHGGIVVPPTKLVLPN
jgi:hypothetical protein